MRLYVSWDQRLAGVTRFFGAAALTNALLAQLHAHGGLWVSHVALQFLDSMGTQLQLANMRLACRLAHAPCYATDLDQRIVWCEQSIVERVLQRLRRTDGAHIQSIVLELDRLLALASSSTLLGTAGLRLYSQVLRGVARDLGRRIQFAGCSDRVRIGCGLIDHLRQQISASDLAELCQPRTRTWTRRLCGGARSVSA
jgi:hypothetical protein